MLWAMAGAVSAVSYNSTPWNQIGRSVNARELIDDLLFLYNRLTLNCNDGDLVKFDKVNKRYSCFACSDGQYLVSLNGDWLCSDYLTFDPGAGCKLKYRIKTSTATSTWAETDWGSANGGDWVYGPTVYATGSRNTVAYEVAVMCDEKTQLDLGYRFRGNRGPYWNTNIGNHSADRISSSRTYAWGSAGFTYPFSKSCNIKGGDGGCGMLILEKNESGAIRCDTHVQFDGARLAPGYTPDKFGSSRGGNGCPSAGCSLRMGIKCEDFTDCSNPNTKLAGGASSYTVADCQAAGGTAKGAPDICICEFNASSCPSGWSQFNNWSSTISQTCSDDSGTCTGTTSCTTGQHSWSDTALETCAYTAVTSGKTTSCVSTTCSATLSSIGCK